MFKKLCVLLFLLLVVFLSVISVNASNELQTNETEIKYGTNTIKNINNSIDDKLSDNNEMVVDTNITISLQQGEHIELVFFNQSNWDYLHCNINDIYLDCEENISDNGLHIYVPISAIGEAPVNVGMNTLNVKSFEYPFIVEKINSNLIHFKTMDLNETQNHNYYSYNFNLNITKKQEKTINIINIMGGNFLSRLGSYDNRVLFKLRDINRFSFKNEVQVILSKNGKIYYNDLNDVDSIDGRNNYFYLEFWCLDYLEYNIFLPGIYNLTLVNYDGTNDTYICEFKKEQWNITFECNIINNSVIFQIEKRSLIHYDDYSDYNMTIKLNNITKSIPSMYFNLMRYIEENFTVLFDNLDDGVYDVVIEIPGNEFIEDFLYTTQIEIGNSSGVPDDNISSDDIIGDNNVTNDTIVVFNNVTGNSDGNSSILSQGNSSGSNLSNVSGSDGEEQFKESSDVDFNNKHVSDYGDLELTGSIHSADNAKSYEISEKPHPELKDDLLSKLGITLLCCMSFMVGYTRFEKTLK